MVMEFRSDAIWRSADGPRVTYVGGMGSDAAVCESAIYRLTGRNPFPSFRHFSLSSQRELVVKHWLSFCSAVFISRGFHGKSRLLLNIFLIVFFVLSFEDLILVPR